MKRNIALVLLLTLGLLVPAPQAIAQATVSDWTYSRDLRQGDFFRWEVNMTWNGEPVTERMNDGPPFIHDSFIEIEILQEPFGLYLTEGMTSEMFAPYFAYNLDGNTTIEPEVMPAALFPNTYIMSDGGEQNVFNFLIANNSYLPFFENENVTHEIVDNQYHASAYADYPDENRTASQWWNFEIDTGVLHWVSITESYTNGSVMEASIGLVEQRRSDGFPGVTGMTWSHRLRAGDYFRWEVNFTRDGVPITEVGPDNDGPPFVHGSYLEVHVRQDPHGYMFQGDNSSALDQIFEFNLDGNMTMDPEIMPALIFPSIFYLEDGGEINAFDYFISNNYPLPFFDGGMNITQEIVNGQYHTEGVRDHPDENRTMTQWWNYQVESGVLHWINMNEFYYNGSVMSPSLGIVEQRTGGGDDDLPEGASFSPLLDTGDRFTWNITEFSERGSTVLPDPARPFEPGQGSEVVMEILNEPELFDLWSEDQDPNAFFGMQIDGLSVNITEVFESAGQFAQFIYPLILKFDNGTTVNFFEFIVDHQDDGIFGNDSDVTASITNNVFSIIVTEYKDDGQRTVVQDLEFNADNGIMRHMYRTETWSNGSEELTMKFDLVNEFYSGGTTSQTSTSDTSSTDSSTEITSSTATNSTDTGTDTPDVSLPFPSMVWILTPVLVTVILRRKS